MTAAPVITFCDYAGLVEALRGLKDHLQLSNATVDRECRFADGWTDKILGPTTTKSLSENSIEELFWFFAVKGTLTIDIDKARALEQYWEKRNASQFRARPNRISKELVERAKPHVLKDFGKLGGSKRANVLTAKHVEAIARKGGCARRRKMTKAARRESARKAGLASAQAKRSRLLTDAAAAALLPSETPALVPLPAPCASQCP